MKWQIIGLLAPTVITQLVAFYLIKKLGRGLLLILTWSVASVLDFYLPHEFIGSVIILTSYAGLVYLGIRWSIDWNKRIDSTQPSSSGAKLSSGSDTSSGSGTTLIS
ncbi:MAG TPA: hypothetical protein VEU72_07030 [Nitrosopumilaceae archaeon]|nr:hypothetical protein [Nitrosopumilaceae archaeon]